MKVLEEIIIANGVAILMMFFLLRCRRKNREKLHMEDRIYDNMAVINLAGAACETIAFAIDGLDLSLGIFLNYFTNSLCFFGTVTIGFLWCMYVDLHIYKNHARIVNKAKIIMIPWLIEVVLIVVNLFGTGVLFTISEDNVYCRGSLVIVGYISLIIYFAYSVYLVYHSKKQGVNLSFFPVMYFVGPCLAGVLIQLFHYGITTAWISVSIALTFVQMQNYSANLMTDELSGLFNRRYLYRILAKYDVSNRDSLYGIMLDINDFKSINDQFGHSKGDLMIGIMGDILTKCLPNGGVGIRYAGDEFIVLLFDSNGEAVISLLNKVSEKIQRFNDYTAESLRLSVSVGYAKYEADDNEESFLIRIDERMYDAKKSYHKDKQELQRLSESQELRLKDVRNIL